MTLAMSGNDAHVVRLLLFKSPICNAESQSQGQVVE